MDKSNWDIASRDAYFGQFCFKWDQINKSWGGVVFSCYCYGAEVVVYFQDGGNDAVETEKKSDVFRKYQNI